MEYEHIPVLLNESISYLDINKNGIYVDCTVGGAGHSTQIAGKLTEKGTLICLDKDIEAIKASEERLKDYKCKKYFFNIDFKDFKQALQEVFKNEPVCVNGFLIDLGVSSYQIDNAERGFSYNTVAPLDMRMNKEQKLTAEYVVNKYDYDDLVKIFYEYGEERFSKFIAKNIVKRREKAPIKTTAELADIIRASVPAKALPKSNSVAKIFQAVRIEVNGELKGLDAAVKEMIDVLKPKGRMCIISFHSLEDRIIKNTFRELATGCICPKDFPICTCGHKAEIKLITKKPVIAGGQEIKANKRSASAKLRVAEKS